MEKVKITIETIVSADIKKVWKCWTQPEHITKWNFASDDWHCPRASNDLRKEGKFNYTMASKDGKMSFDFEGIYTAVTELKHIAYKMADGRNAVIDFIENGKEIKVIETFETESQNSIELQRAGWQSILNNFKHYTESV